MSMTMRRARKTRLLAAESNSGQLIAQQRMAALEDMHRIASSEIPTIQKLFDEGVSLWQSVYQAILTGISAFLDLDSMTVSALNDIIGSVVSRGLPVREELFPTLLSICEDYTMDVLEPVEFARKAMTTLLEISGAPKDRAMFVAEMAYQGINQEIVKGQPEREQIAALIRACAVFYYDNCLRPRQQVLMIQRNVKKWLVWRGLDEVAKDFDMKRSRTIRALVVEERKFTNLMGQIIKHFYEPLCTGKLILPQEKTKIIFSSLPKLSIMHARFDERLRKVAEQEWPRAASLGTLAIESEKLFAEHEAYALNYDYAVSVLQENLSTNKLFRQTITQGEAALNKAGTNTDLMHALAAPNNRLDTFEALYRSLLTAWKRDDPSYETISRAVDVVAAAKKKVEIAQKQGPKRRKALQIINQLGGYSDVIVENGLRLLLLENPITLISKNKSKKDIYVYLMTDVVILAKRKNPKTDGAEDMKKKHLLRAIPLKELRIVQDDPPVEAANPTLLSLLIGPANEVCDMITMNFQGQAERTAFRDTLRSLSIKMIAREKCVTASPPNPVFGTDLIEIVTTEQEAAAAAGVSLEVTMVSGVSPSNLVPVFVQKTIERLQQPSSLECEGLFRLSGSASRMNGIRKNVENSATPFSWDFQPGDDPLSIASVLKAFLRELPNPLMSLDLQDELIQAWKGDGQDIFTQEAEIAAVKRVCVVMERLPKEYLATFLAINTLLEHVAEKASENKMNPRNLSIVFAPNYFGQADFDQIGGELMQRSFDLTAALIANNALVREHFAKFASRWNEAATQK